MLRPFFLYVSILAMLVATNANNTRLARSLVLEEVEGPVFLQSGGNMTNIFGQDRKGALWNCLFITALLEN